MKAFTMRIKRKPFFDLLDLMDEIDAKIHFLEHEQLYYNSTITIPLNPITII